MSDFAFRSIADLADGLARRAFSPVELLDDVIARCGRLEPRLNMFCHTDFDAAQGQARAATERMMRGTRLGPLDGIPTAVKDLIPVAGMPQRFGSRSVPGTPPAPADAPAVARLRTAGAVILGTSTTSEFGCKAVGASPLTGVTRNPWNLANTSGGSSAGSAAMVAAGLVPYALGTDGGGSIRIPAAMCGIFGIKAQFGRVPVYPFSATPTLAHVGPLTRTADDAATVLGLIAGHDPRDPGSLPRDAPDFGPDRPHGPRLRIAWSPGLGYGHADPEVLEIAARAVAQVEALGHAVDTVAHVMDDPLAAWTSEFYGGVAARLADTIRTHPDLIDPPVLERLRAAQAQTAGAHHRGVRDRYALGDAMHRFFGSFDLLLTPTLPVAEIAAGQDLPQRHGGRGIIGWATFTYPFNLTGQPAASIPAGFTATGAPVGLQIVGPSLSERRLLAFAAELAHALDLNTQPRMDWAQEPYGVGDPEM